MSAALKIMFGHVQPYTLSRNEIVALLNLMIKLSNSLSWYNSIVENESNLNLYRIIGKISLTVLVACAGIYL